MDCPHCHAPNQEDRYCVKCGAPLHSDSDSLDLSKELDTNRSAINETNASDSNHSEGSFIKSLSTRLRTLPPKQVILFLAGACTMLFILCIILLLNGGKSSFGPERSVVVTNQSQPESEAVKALRKAPALTPEEDLAQDKVVGYWQHYSESGIIEKVGKDKYRWLIGDRTFMVTFDDDHYDVTPDEENYYSFAFEGADELVLKDSHTVSGKAIKNPVFAPEYAVSRLDQDGQPARHTAVNADAFNIVGKTYGQLAGMYGPGSLTVINGEQFVVFRDDGGNFAVSFVGSTVPLASKTPSWQAKPLEGDVLSTYRILPLTNSETPSAGDRPNEPANNNDHQPASPTPPEPTPQEPAKPDEHRDDEKDSSPSTPVEVPNPATFPSVSAVAQGVVWADLGYLINDCPRIMNLDKLAKLLGVTFETGKSGQNGNGYLFYGAKDGYFAATYRSDNRKYKLSGYGRQLDRSKTIIFIEPLS